MKLMLWTREHCRCAFFNHRYDGGLAAAWEVVRFGRMQGSVGHVCGSGKYLKRAWLVAYLQRAMVALPVGFTFWVSKQLVERQKTLDQVKSACLAGPFTIFVSFCVALCQYPRYRVPPSLRLQL